MTVEIAAVALAAFVIGFSKTGVGGGLGPFITALMALAFEPQVALAILLPLLMVGDVFSLAALWRKWSVRDTIALLPGAVVGIAVGTYFVSAVSAESLRLTLGIFVLAFVAYFLLRPRLDVGDREVTAKWTGWLAGTTAGAASALAHAGAPPVTIYLLLRKLEPVRFVATTVLVFAAVNLIKVPAYAAAGLFDWQLQLSLWWAVPIIPVGVAVGRLTVRRINEVWFHRLITALLAVTGVVLIVG